LLQILLRFISISLRLYSSAANNIQSYICQRYERASFSKLFTPAAVKFVFPTCNSSLYNDGIIIANITMPSVASGAQFIQ